jgi:hypothetical protein
VGWQEVKTVAGWVIGPLLVVLVFWTPWGLLSKWFKEEVGKRNRSVM